MRINICSIKNNLYYISREDSPDNHYLLWKNREPIAAIIPIEYTNYCEAYRIRHKQIPYSNAYVLDVYDQIALEEAIALLNQGYEVLRFYDKDSN